MISVSVNARQALEYGKEKEESRKTGKIRNKKKQCPLHPLIFQLLPNAFTLKCITFWCKYISKIK